MSWLDPPPLVPKPLPPEIKLPTDVRPANITIIVAASCFFFAGAAFATGYAIFAGLAFFGTPVARIRGMALVILTGLGALFGFFSALGAVQSAIRETTSHDHG